MATSIWLTPLAHGAFPKCGFLAEELDNPVQRAGLAAASPLAHFVLLFA